MKKKLWKWPVLRAFLFIFFFVSPTLNLKKNSRKSTYKKNSGLRSNDIYGLNSFHDIKPYMKERVWGIAPKTHAIIVNACALS